ncbi:Short-chain dehydrogenase/reductase SDR [Neofusicoccum parvum]|nr:Short-chain dehydrogenase/reductase SDR [Neofusicoccum parvum]
MAPSLSVILSFLHSQLFVTVPKPTSSFAGRTVIVTGANVGLGLETARTIASLGAAKVIISSRSTAKGEAAAASIVSTTGVPADRIEVWPLDLCSYASVRSFAERAKALPQLDALVCNAGVATGSFALAEGHESTITTNVISTFLLSFLLLPKLREAAARTNAPAHLVIVSSEVHFFTDYRERLDPRGPFEALRDEAAADMPDRYNVSKLLEVLVVREIAGTPGLAAAASPESPYPVVITAPNPGLCASALRREFYEGAWWKRWGMWALEVLLERTSEEGARNFVTCASAGANYHGQYVSDGVPKAPAKLVLSEEGKKAQKVAWEELRDILEEIEPGVTKNL